MLYSAHPKSSLFGPLTITAAVFALTACSAEEPDPFADIPEFAVESPVVQVLSQGQNPQVWKYEDGASADSETTAPQRVALVLPHDPQGRPSPSRDVLFLDEPTD